MKFRDRLKKIIPALLAIVVLLPFLSRLSGLSVEDILSHTPQSLPLASLVFLLMYCVKSVTVIIPSFVLYISAGVLFPMGWALLLTYVCVLCEMTISYWIGRRAGEKQVETILRKHKKAALILGQTGKRRSATLLLGRLLPLPFDVVSAYFGAVGMPYSSYIAVSVLGVTPSVVLYVLAGSAIQEPLSVEFFVPVGLIILFVGLAVVAYWRWAKKRPVEQQETGNETII